MCMSASYIHFGLTVEGTVQQRIHNTSARWIPQEGLRLLSDKPNAKQPDFSYDNNGTSIDSQWAINTSSLNIDSKRPDIYIYIYIYIHIYIQLYTGNIHIYMHIVKNIH